MDKKNTEIYRLVYTRREMLVLEWLLRSAENSSMSKESKEVARNLLKVINSLLNVRKPTQGEMEMSDEVPKFIQELFETWFEEAKKKDEEVCDKANKNLYYMGKETQRTHSTAWTDPKMMKLEDDKNYLVRWLDADGHWHVPAMSYYDEEENKFFPLHTDLSFPLLVHQAAEIPK